jgi:hypothetical protein
LNKNFNLCDGGVFLKGIVSDYALPGWGKTVDTLLGQWTERPKWAPQKAKRLHLPKNTHLITVYTAYLKYFSVWLIFLIYFSLFNNVSSAEWACTSTTEIRAVQRRAEKSSHRAQWTMPAT